MLHATEGGKYDLSGAEVYLFDENGEYLGLNGITDSDGEAVFQVPEGQYRLKLIYGGTEHWSDLVHTLPYQENPVEMALGWLSLHSNPHPKRFHGKPPEYRPLLAFTGTSLPGLLAQTVTGTLTLDEPVTYYYISDHLNTAQLLTDENGEVVWQGNYSPFGAVDVVINEVENNFRFPGQMYDAETGLYYNWNRYYDPATGRYISADPIGLQGGMNLFAYVFNNPIIHFDTTGLF